LLLWDSDLVIFKQRSRQYADNALISGDMIQVALSIQAGRVMPSMLLRKLGAYSRRSPLYRAFRALWRVEPTLFLLRFVSSVEVRRTIRGLVALSALPAIWVGYQPHQVAESLADVLLNTLPLEFVYLRLRGLADGREIEVARTGRPRERGPR